MTTAPLAHSYIRFSSKRQERGDSIRRQTALRDRWLAESGVQLSDLEFHDLAVSGFKGANRLTGALSQFIRLAKEGEEVRAGDYLVIEQIDRLSRQNPYEALPLITELVNLGIRIVDLDLGGSAKIYDKAYLQTNQYALVELVVKFARAHEESKVKQQRTLAARETAMGKLKAEGRKIRQRLPAWIKWAPDGRTMVLDERRAATVRRIVDMAMDGLGAVSIAARLNAENVPPISDRRNTTNWEFSTIQFYLRTRILIGEYQPTQAVEGSRRQPVGDPIPDYYPRLLTDAEYYKLQAVLQTRATGKRQGRDGKNIANLFGRLLVNGYDGGTMTLIQKRAENVNMVSLNAVRGLAAPCSFPYPVFERAFLRWVREIEVTNKRSAVTSKLDERLGRLSAVVHKIEVVSKRLTDADGTVYERMAEELARLAREEKEIKAEIQQAKQEAAAPQVTTREVVSIADQLAAARGDELTALRARLRQAIATVVERIDVFPSDGRTPLVRHAGCVVTLKNGLVRAYALRYERGRDPFTAVWNGDAYDPAALGCTADQFRKRVGKITWTLAMLSYDDLWADTVDKGGSAIVLN